MQKKNLSRAHQIGLVIFYSCLLFCMTGCFSSNKADLAAFTVPDEQTVSVDSYLLQPPDEILVLCAKVPELNLRHQRIRPDGKVSFEGIGDVHIAGKTPEEAAELLKAKALVATGISVDVSVSKFESKYYYIFGQVNRPGAMDLTGRDTVMSAVAKAGLIPRSWEERIQVVRPSNNKDVDAKVFEVNLKDMFVRGDTSKNVLLEEGDIVFVPSTILGSVGLALEEVLAPVRQVFSTVNVATGTPGTR